MKNELYSKRMSAAAHFGWTVLSKAAKAYLVRQGITREMVDKMHEKSSYRIVARFRNANIGVSRVHKIVSDLNYFAEIPFEYQGDGLDDFEKFQRPSSNGVGYVAICPGERGNNYYVDDPVTVAILRRRYDEWKMKQPA